jgi:hypothetical protein
VAHDRRGRRPDHRSVPVLVPISPATAAWLLDPSDPTVRRLARARIGLLDEAAGPPADPPGPAPATADEPWVRALLAPHVREPSRVPGAVVHPYQKWRGAHWRLVSLAELDANPSEPAVAAAIERDEAAVQAWLTGPARLARARPVRGRARICGSQEGNVAWAGIRLGLASDVRIELAVERLVGWQWPDGGWNCDVRPEVVHSSFNETWPALRALAAYARARPRAPLGAAAAAGAQRAASFLLDHRVVCSHRTGRLAQPVFDGQRWPAYWHYDRLAGLRVLADAGRLGDPGAATALDDLRAAAGPDGRWRPSGRWWRRPGSSGANVEAVDWGAGGEAKMVTLLALEVLAAA